MRQMDIFCPKCGEPCDIDYLHEVAEDDGKTFQEVYHQFQKQGCIAVGWKCSEILPQPADGKLSKAEAVSALYDLLGDDVDGVASMMDDGEFLGLID